MFQASDFYSKQNLSLLRALCTSSSRTGGSHDSHLPWLADIPLKGACALIQHSWLPDVWMI